MNEMRSSTTSGHRFVADDETDTGAMAPSHATAASIFGAVMRRAGVMVGLVLACLLADAAVALATPTFTPVLRSPFTTSGPGNRPHEAAFSPSGAWLATANNSNPGSVSVFSVGSDGTLTQLSSSPTGAGTNLYAVAFSPSGGVLGVANAGGSPGSVSVFSVDAEGALAPVEGSPYTTDSTPEGVAFSSADGLLATANRNPSDVSMFVTTPPPVDNAPPQITGTAQQGETLSVSNGGWTNSPSSYTYQWQGCDSQGGHCVNIDGATSNT